MVRRARGWPNVGTVMVAHFPLKVGECDSPEGYRDDRRSVWQTVASCSVPTHMDIICTHIIIYMYVCIYIYYIFYTHIIYTHIIYTYAYTCSMREKRDHFADLDSCSLGARSGTLTVRAWRMWLGPSQSWASNVWSPGGGCCEGVGA